ncbi:MAG: flagellin [Candidatus Thermoplasmatota archaeon]
MEKIKNIIKILRERDAGDIGIGAMIVFIAMVLVAGIAAAVLIQTANRLEIQAMQTGEQTKGEVSTGVHVLDITGHKDSGTGAINYIGITITTRAGSGDVDLEQVFVEIADINRKHVMKYYSTEFHEKSEINGDIFQAGFFDGLNGQRFGVVVLEDADGSCQSNTPVINRGDKVMLLIHCGSGRVFNGPVSERTDIWGLVQPEEGSGAVFAFRTPQAYSNTVMDLY